MSTPAPSTDIAAGAPDRAYWRDLWRYRELLGFLAWRDLKVRYKQAVLGIAWALIQPAITMVVFTIIFGHLAGMPSYQGVPYSLLVLSGMLPWQLFSSAFNGASGSLLSNSGLISKIYFPRLIIPLSSLAVALVDFLVAIGLYTAITLWYVAGAAAQHEAITFLPTWRIAFLPIFILLAVSIAFGIGAWITALTVRYRDFRYITPFMLQVGFFVTPVAYHLDNLPNWYISFALNPMTCVIGGFRWCLLGETPRLDPVVTFAGFFVAVFIVASGIWHFRQTERSLADEI